MKCNLPEEYKHKSKPQGSMSISMYDLNKSMVAQMPPMTDEARKEHNKQFEDFYMNTGNNYYMLLCKELSYYTLFHQDDLNVDNFAETVDEMLGYLGEWITWNYSDDSHTSIEYWVKVCRDNDDDSDDSEDDIYCVILFPYDQGVVEVK